MTPEEYSEWAISVGLQKRPLPGVHITEREALVKILLRFNPWGGYCVEPCKHPGHSTEAYRRTVERITATKSPS